MTNPLSTVTIFETISVGPDGHNQLKSAFFELIKLLRPTIFCEIGAHNGSISKSVSCLGIDCNIHAYEANPEIFDKHHKSLQSKSINYHNIAINDLDELVEIHIPRTLSQAYVNGSVIPASIDESSDTGKASLLLRDEAATYVNYDVTGAALDTLFNGTVSNKDTFFLWIDVEGATKRVLDGALNVLKKTQVIFVELENFPFWRNASSMEEVIQLLANLEFVPLARDSEYGDHQFNMLFVASSLLNFGFSCLSNNEKFRLCSQQTTKAPSSFSWIMNLPFFRQMRWDRLSPPLIGLSRHLQHCDLPVFVPCFNNLTYTKRMISQLKERRFSRIILLDGGSTYLPMINFMKEIRTHITVISLEGNPGPHHIFMDEKSYATLPRHFCVTDPDLDLNRLMPKNFIEVLKFLAKREKIGKVGLALDLSDRHLMRDQQFEIGERTYQIWEWEKQFWNDRLNPTEDGDPVFRAAVDTTFALYDKEFFDPNNNLDAVRIAGRFTCSHLPWYRDKLLPTEEEKYYRDSQKYSYYLGYRE